MKIWRDSTPAKKLISTPTMRPDPTRYLWFSQRFGVGKILHTLPGVTANSEPIANRIHNHIPYAGEIVGTPATIQLQGDDLPWLLGAQDHDANSDQSS
jgi:hypothetical protein